MANAWFYKGKKKKITNSIDLDKKVPEKIVRKQWIVRKMWKLNENQTRVKFDNSKLVSADMSDLLKTFKDGALKACDEVRV